MESLSDIAVFVRVVRRGSFTAAAHELGISRSVVSKYVTRLEDRLGARLLNRTTRRLRLTESGQAFFERRRHALGESEGAAALAEREMNRTNAKGIGRHPPPRGIDRDPTPAPAVGLASKLPDPA